MATEQFEDLLQRLRNAEGLTHRMRIARESLDLIRTLSPRERERVAMRMGSDWAWKRLEPLLMRDGRFDEHDDLAKRALEEFGSADPDELRSLARSARTGDFAGLRDALFDRTRNLYRDVEPEAAPPAAQATEEAEQAAEEAEQAAEEAAQASEAVSAEAPPPVEPEAPRPIVQEPAPPPVRDVAKAVPAKAFPEMNWDVPLERRAEAAPAHVEISDAPLTSARARLRVLRRLREDPGYARQLGRGGRARLLSRLGGGWPVGRALSQMIRSHSYDDLDEALSWIAGLETGARRTWCLGDLLEHAELDSSEVERILAAAPTPATRRRLERRWAG